MALFDSDNAERRPVCGASEHEVIEEFIAVDRNVLRRFGPDPGVRWFDFGRAGTGRPPPDQVSIRSR